MTSIQNSQGHLYQQHQSIMVISTWGFVIAFASFLFLYLGYKIDQYFGSAPSFMFGMFFLAIFLTIGRLYQDAWLRRKSGNTSIGSVCINHFCINHFLSLLLVCVI